MIRTSSVNGSEEMKNEGLAMSIETLTPSTAKEWIPISFRGVVRRDPEDSGSVQVREFVFDAGEKEVIAEVPEKITVKITPFTLLATLMGQFKLEVRQYYKQGYSSSKTLESFSKEIEITSNT